MPSPPNPPHGISSRRQSPTATDSGAPSPPSANPSSARVRGAAHPAAAPANVTAAAAGRRATFAMQDSSDTTIDTILQQPNSSKNGQAAQIIPFIPTQPAAPAGHFPHRASLGAAGAADSQLSPMTASSNTRSAAALALNLPRMYQPLGDSAELASVLQGAFQGLFHAHAAALNREGPPVPFRALTEYDDVKGTAHSMEAFLCGLDLQELRRVAVNLHRALAASAAQLACKTELTSVAARMRSNTDASRTAAAAAAAESSRPHMQLDLSMKSMMSATENEASILSQSAALHSSESLTAPSSVQMTNKLQITEDEIGMKVVNQYTLLKELGRGSFGKVKLAAGAGDELVAIKVIAHAQVRARALSSGVGSGVGSGGGEETLAAVEREVALMAKLRHKNVLRLREVINDPEARHMYLVMNYAERGPLLALRANGTCTALDFDVARGYMKQLLSGLHYLHARRVWHRDIKPSNILLGGDGVVYFADFGVSSYFDVVDDGGGGGGGGGQQQQLRDAAGTPAFHAPEVWSGEAYLGGPADVWALGVTFYAMVYGRLPFRGATSAELRRAVCEGELEFPDLFDSRMSGTCVGCEEEEDFGEGAAPPLTLQTPELYEGCGAFSLSRVARSNALSSSSDALGADLARFHDQLALQELLRQMLDKDPAKRPSALECRKHAFVHRARSGQRRVKRQLEKHT